ncbi:MAG: hypothetical protein KAR35_03845 [Candidatus Heimdallarchaeota archaeon]|nr:hypothetical protein [Candidatus Heimdallarchaeota archaeon]MCK5048487.1 hypothetical protein [Candidatus Heimdallarchaeota archaeon]
MKENEQIELISQEEMTLKETILVVLGVEVFYLGMLSAIMFSLDSNFLEDSVLASIYIVLSLIIGIGIAAGSYKTIYDEISQIIMTPDEIIIINQFDKVTDRLTKMELNLIKRETRHERFEVCTVDISKEFSLAKFEKDEEKRIELGDRIMEFCNEHFPNATNSEYFNEKNRYKISNEARTGTKL